MIYLELITVNSLKCATILISRNAVLDAIRKPNTKYPPHPNTLIRVDNAEVDSWTRKISTSSPTDKTLNKLFFILFMNQQLSLDRA